MRENGNNPRTLTIHNLSSEGACRLASKLLVGMGRWEVLWSRNEVRVTLREEYVEDMVKDSVSILSKIAFEKAGDEFYQSTPTLWNEWKQDFRFTDMILDEACKTVLSADLMEHFKMNNALDVETWARNSAHLRNELTDIHPDLQTEGNIATKLESFGWA
ncbi:hypothetical protein [Rossellomorea marisflavi]|uniref:hypothetical protein n=1 Tax=Rossellomorea marisflavi TaxID=189381 RepID=UPI003F9EE0B6